MPRPDTILSSQTFHMLMALTDGELHGSAIMQSVLEQSGGRIRLWPAMLYRYLEQLLADGLIAELPKRPTSVAGSPRFFRLTPRGQRACQAEATRLAGVVELARSKRLLGKQGR